MQASLTVSHLDFLDQNSSSINDFPNWNGWVEQAFGGRGSISRIWLLVAVGHQGGVGPSHLM